MARVLAACLAWLICSGGSAWANKPKIAVLGLEVIPGPSGTVEPTVTQVARDITTDLRQRVQSAASPYVMAQNSAKELTDEKLLMSCDNEATPCMAAIGTGLAADFLLYGHIEKKGDLYRVTLKLLDVDAKTLKSGNEDMPIGGGVPALSRKLYHKLIGDLPAPSSGSGGSTGSTGAAGAVVITARSRSGQAIDGGRVIVDDVPRGVLTGGKLTLAGVSDGRRVVAIEAPGYPRFEETVVVRGGRATVEALLADEPAPVPRAAHSPVWKWSLGTGIALTIGGAAFAYYSYDQMANKNKVMYQPADPTMVSEAPDAGDCGLDAGEILTRKNAIVTNPGAFERACTWKNRIYIGYVVGGVGAIGAVISLIMLSRDAGPAERPASGPRAKKSGVAIVPIVRPDVAGASLSVRW